ncbi:epoxyqueuosine reductase [Sporomusa aerivorans]|uniref:epoxyqueuosine reductase n=1 Tax=Sporomusa aerivorans TaxID=204936 RepID=UPI00352A9A0F
MGKLEDAIKAKAIDMGYEACGIIEAASFTEFLAGVEERSALFPHAASFYENLKGRVLANPQDNFSWAQSIVVCLRRYDKYEVPANLEQLVAKVFLFDGRVSHSSEYAGHAQFGEFLQASGFQTAQVMLPARWAAAKAGLGKFRNNNFLYTRQGSWNWIDTWLIDKQLEYEKPVENARYTCPADCNKCVKACPTGALSAPLTMDATRCIAYLTFNAAESLPAEDVRESMGTYIYGCDECQNACPVNTWQGKAAFPEPVPLEDMLTLDTLFSMGEETYRTQLQPRFWYIAKENFWQWRCNVIRAMVNENPEKYAKYFAQALADPHEHVKQMAQWALSKVN